MDRSQARRGGGCCPSAARVKARPQKAIPHTAPSLPDRQHAQGASLGRVPPECRRGHRKLSHRRPPHPLFPAEPPSQQTVLGATPWMLASTQRWPVLAGCRQSEGEASESYSTYSSVITGPPARAGGQSWQGAARVPARPQKAIPPSAAAPPAPLLNRRACRRCWAQHHGRSQAVAVASLGRVPAECRRGLRKLFHIQLRHYRTASTRRGPVLAGCRQSAGEASGRRLLPPAVCCCQPPAAARRTVPLVPPRQQTMLGTTPWSLAGSGGGQSWQGAGNVPSRAQGATPHPTEPSAQGPRPRQPNTAETGLAKTHRLPALDMNSKQAAP